MAAMWFAAKKEGATEEGTRRTHSRDQQEAWRSQSSLCHWSI